ncbi:MAG: YceI family protein [Imperialibacter sp.]|uniref:YceI family protein n=1 Tax=Imperialibacter sp. TaxID=2038411 RepID=UPI0032EC4978
MNLTSTKTLFASLIAAGFLTACGGGNATTESSAETAATEEVAAMTYTVDPTSSVVAWKGEVAGVYGHNGVIEVANGSVIAEGTQLTGGDITIDMTSIVPLDSASFKDEEGRRASDLVGHLSTGDFFLVEEFPTATFTIKSQEGSKVTGDLTIRGKTKEETMELSSMEVTDGGLSAEGVLVFNRQDYDVKWVHFMKDMVLADNIEIKVSIKAAKS